MQTFRTGILSAVATAAWTFGNLGTAYAKLPQPTAEAKARAEAVAAKAAFANKVAAYQLCLAQDRVAAAYLKSRSAPGTPAKRVEDVPACQDPGAYIPAQEAAMVGIADSLPLNKEPVKK